jgi:hypothetical protein
MHYSTNNGVSWSFFTVNGDLNVSVINTTSPQIGFYNGYIGGANKILFTSNTGSNWVENTSLPGTGNIIGLHKQSLPVDMLGFYNIYASRGSNTIQYLGAYNSNWVLNYTSPAGNYTHISNRLPSQVWAVRDNGGISYCGCMLSGINMISSEIPKTYALTQNYPNPFNPTTNINFDLPNSGFVKLIIYDLLGREITRLVNQQMQAGSYSADWDAANYPSGVYFYSLLTEDFAETKKMVLVK